MTVTLLDGGMGQELVARAGKATPLWAVQALLDSPEMVRAVHDDYFAAGAEIATTNTYAVLPDRFENFGISDQLGHIMARACELACASRDAHGSGQVAGSMGPLGFSYQPDKSPPSDIAAEDYANCARLQAPFVDMHLLETMSSIDQARGGLMGAGVTGKPVWIALSVDDDDGTKLRSGEPLVDAKAILDEFKPAAVLLNCSLPEAIETGFATLADMGYPCGAYANGFTGISDEFDHIGVTVDSLESRTDLGPAAYADFTDKWIAKGATIIGGCCEVGPAHIAEISKRLKGA